ncbi:Reverse transcriptase (RNA-dependent DNA polymerase) [Popillia japonica]|uniref:Reverse transcriptase (RNA-dependent DNA polymerase) n=1 Tax=Popillia japonica TaxID=7064 RepID=A0AAW1JIR9_POPJA
MKKLGIPVELIKITSWLQERKFKVKILQSLSQERNATEGLPQDSPLSLLLFDIFVIDLPEAITVPNSRVFQFADDTLIVVQGLKLELSLKK